MSLLSNEPATSEVGLGRPTKTTSLAGDLIKLQLKEAEDYREL